jgi:glutaredoxin
MSPDLDLLRGHRFEVYSSSDCPDCTRLMRWMERAGLEAGVVLIGEDEGAAEKLERETGMQAVPFILVDGKTWVRGYHTEERGNFNESRLLAELKQAIAPS